MFNTLFRFKWLVFALFMSVILYAVIFRITFNPSISEPRGYYFMYSSKNYKKGDIVLICLEEYKYIEILHKFRLPFDNNNCGMKTPYLLKTIVASDGDVIVNNKNGLVINGIQQRNSIALDNYNRINLYPLKKRRFKLQINQFFVLGNTPHSYDSRYFGIIKKEQIQSKAYLIWAKNSPVW